RLSLIVYFLLLLGAALGGVSWFAYHSTRQALAAKEESTTNLLTARYEATRKQVEADFDRKMKQVVTDFDRKLLERARRLADRLDSRSVWLRNQHESLIAMGLLGTPWQKQGYLSAVASLTPPPEGSRRFPIWKQVWIFGFRLPDEDDI